MTWPDGIHGAVTLPSGRRVRGRSLREGTSSLPDWGLYLASTPPEHGWPQRWVKWRDFWTPADDIDARDAIHEAWERCVDERVEVGCGRGVGRTGTVLAAMAMLDGLSADRAVKWVRAVHHPRAVEGPWQRRWLDAFPRGRAR